MDSLLNLLSSDGYTPVNKCLSRNIGFTVAGYLGELIRQRERFFEKFGIEEFYFSQKQMTEELGFSKYEQSQAVKKLVSLGFLKVEKKGIPCKYHFMLCDDVILDYIKQVYSGQKIEPLVDKELNHLQLENGTTSDLKNEPHNNKGHKEINNKSINNSKELFIDKSDQNFGNLEINNILETLKKLNNGLIDGTVKEQRNYGKLLRDKIQKINGFDGDFEKFLNKLYELSDEYRVGYFSSPKKLYYNLAGVVQSITARVKEKPKPVRRNYKSLSVEDYINNNF